MTKKGMYYIDLKDGSHIKTAGDGLETDFFVVNGSPLVVIGNTVVLNASDIKSVIYTSDEHVAKEDK